MCDHCVRWHIDDSTNVSRSVKVFCETCQNVKSKLEGWWQLQSMHLCIFCRVENHVKMIRPTIWPSKKWKGWMDCISEYIMYTFDKQGRQDGKPAHSETLLSSVSLWMIFIIIIWIIRILGPRWWFCTSSGRPVWFHFTYICWKIAQGICQLGTKSLSLLCSDYSSSDSLCRYMAFILCILWLSHQVRMSWNRYCWELHR